MQFWWYWSFRIFIALWCLIVNLHTHTIFIQNTISYILQKTPTFWQKFDHIFKQNNDQLTYLCIALWPKESTFLMVLLWKLRTHNCRWNLILASIICFVDRVWPSRCNVLLLQPFIMICLQSRHQHKFVVCICVYIISPDILWLITHNTELDRYRNMNNKIRCTIVQLVWWNKIVGIYLHFRIIIKTEMNLL